MPTPLRITAGATRRAHFTTENIPGKVFQPGERGYHGPRVGANRGRSSFDNANFAADRANARDPHHPHNDPNRPGTRTAGAIVALGAGAPVLGGAALIPVARRNWKKREQEARARLAAVNKDWKGDEKPFHAEDPGIRHAQQHDGAWRVNSMGPGLRKDPLSRLGRAALKHEHLPGTLGGLGIFTGTAVAMAGINGPKKRAEQAQRELANARRRARRAGVAKLAPKPRSFRAATVKEHFGSPRKAAATLRRNPEHLAAAGVLGLAVASRAPSRDRDRTPEQRQRAHRASNAAGGAIAGQAAFLGTGYKIRALGHRHERWNQSFPMSRSAHAKTMKEFHRAQGVPSNTKPLKHQQASFYRNYPEGMPATKYKRALGHMSGRKGRVIQAGFLGTGALAGAASTRGQKQEVGKALYERTSRPSILRTGEAVAGGALLAWGAGRSKMIGSALGHGVKMAEARGSARAVEALQRAQAAQGALRRGTRPAERTLRQVQAVDRAVRAVPAPLRGDVATAAGILLLGNAHPINRNTYRPIAAPSVPYRTVGW